MTHPLLIMISTYILFIVAYKTYGTYIAKYIFNCQENADVPSKTCYDGLDYVPSSKQVMFGHHFTSIAGTGPIVGPAIGIIWGWVPALLWVVFGSVFMGAVHDFSALIISMRHQGRSLSDIAGDVINPKVRRAFFIIVCLALWIVIAIFGLVIALIFAQFPASVIAVWIEIPIAIIFGRYLLKKKGSVWMTTAIAVGVLYGFVWMGQFLPIYMPSFSWIPATGLWTVILLVYAFIASVLPVSTLLQPRDYLNAWQLYVALGLIIMGAVVTGLTDQLHFVAPAVNLMPEGAPSMWPFLCITIACGALSGFHCLVCSGTSSKQISSESDAQFIGFGSMLLEAALAIVVIIAVGAGIGIAYPDAGGVLTGSAAFQAHYGSWQASAGLGSKLSAVVIGCANMMASIGIPLAFGKVIVGVFIASFAGTTLDSATRVQRYIISELARETRLKALSNKWAATAFAVISAALLAFSSGLSGKGALSLWPLFGAVNQLLGALALCVATVYILKHLKKAAWVTGIPCILVCLMTGWATVENQLQFWHSKHMTLFTLNTIILALSVIILIEAVRYMLTLVPKRQPHRYGKQGA